MINIDRVKHMTHMAIFEKEEFEECRQMLKYDRKDYIALHGWGGFFSGTLVFVVIYTVVVLLLFGNVFETVSALPVLIVVLVGLLLYAVYIVFHVYRVRVKASIRYKQGKLLQKELIRQYDILEEMYEKEAQEKTPAAIRNTMKINLNED